jgi:prevent-host-death family protein
MNVLFSIWNASRAKAELSTVIDHADEKPQIIERHGKPAAAIIGWALYQRYRELLEGTMSPWLQELKEINAREGEMDRLIREDRPLPKELR